MRFLVIGDIESHKEALEKLECLLRDVVLSQDFICFLVGRNGDFDSLASSAVRKIKKRVCGDNSALTLVLPYTTAEYKNNAPFFEAFYDEIEICEKSSGVHFKKAIEARNQCIIDRADMVICYVEKSSGGAYKALVYAMCCGKKIINLATAWKG